MTVFDLKNGFHYAMHGNGAYKGLRQTNTEDALLYWYHKGIRIFEIDMAKTDDEQYVAVAHDLNDNSLKRLEIFDIPKTRTADWFMMQKLFDVSTKGLKPLSLQGILDILVEHQDIIVMLDLFGMFSKEESAKFTQVLCDLVTDRSIENRLLLEAYNFEMIEGISSNAERFNVIYCARYEDNLHDTKAVSAEELILDNVKFVSYPWYCTKFHPGEIEDYVKHGIIVFSRTKYNTKKCLLKEAGVSVNIIAKRFDGWKIAYQWPAYMFTYLKRIFVKLYVKRRTKGNNNE